MRNSRRGTLARRYSHVLNLKRSSENTLELH